MWFIHSEKSDGKEAGKLRKKYIRLVWLEILHLIILVGIILFLIYML
jgi:hypothetical protein